MSVKSKRRQWQKEKEERNQFLVSHPVNVLIPQPDGSYKQETMSWRSAVRVTHRP